jgi:hypothetical protein
LSLTREVDVGTIPALIASIFDVSAPLQRWVVHAGQTARRWAPTWAQHRSVPNLRDF